MGVGEGGGVLQHFETKNCAWKLGTIQKSLWIMLIFLAWFFDLTKTDSMNVSCDCFEIAENLSGKILYWSHLLT